MGPVSSFGSGLAVTAKVLALISFFEMSTICRSTGWSRQSPCGLYWRTPRLQPPSDDHRRSLWSCTWSQTRSTVRSR
jgi:hypothetical protein